MKYNFIKIFAILLLSSVFNIAWFWSSEEESQAKRLENINEAIKLSRNQLFEGNTNIAIELLQKAYGEHGETQSLCEALAYAYSQAKQYSSAAIYFEKAFRLSENNVILLLNAGRAYVQCNASSSALSAYERYLEIMPKDANIWKEVALIEETKANYQKALNAYMQFLKNAGRNPNTQEAKEIAKLFLKLKNIVQAKAWFTSALAACDATNVEVKSEILAGLIDIALAESDMLGLEEHYEVLKSINPKFLDRYYPKLQSDILAYKIKLQEAKIALEEAQKREQEAKALEAKKQEEEKLEAERLAKEATEKEEAQKLAKAKEEEERLAKEAKEKEEAQAKLVEDSAAIRAILDPSSQEESKVVESAEIEQVEQKAQVAEQVEQKTQAKEVAGLEQKVAGLEQKTQVEQKAQVAEVSKTEQIEGIEEESQAEEVAEEAKEVAVLEEMPKSPKISEAKIANLNAERKAPTAPKQELIDAPKNPMGAQIYQFQALMDSKDFSAAENLAQRIVADNPNSARAWGVLAKAYQAQGMQIDAFLAAKQAQSKDKSDIKATLLRIQLGVGIESEKTFLANLVATDKAFPECPPVLVALARTYEYFGNTTESKKAYDKFLESTSKKDPLYADVLEEMSTLDSPRKLDIKSIAKDLEL